MEGSGYMKITAKIAACACACAMAFGLFGCGGSDQNAQEVKEYTTDEITAQEVEVLSSGYSISDDGTVNFAFFANNPNEGYVARNLTFTIEGYDDEDVMLIGGGQTVTELYPNVETAVAGTTYLANSDKSIARFEIIPMMDTVLWEKTTGTAEDYENKFTIDVDTQSRNDLGELVIDATVTGQVGPLAPENPSNNGTVAGFEEGHAVCVLYDASGKIVGGGFSGGFILDNSSVITAEAPDANAVSEEGEEGESTDSGEPDTNSEHTAATTVSIIISNPPAFDKIEVFAYPGM